MNGERAVCYEVLHVPNSSRTPDLIHCSSALSRYEGYGKVAFSVPTAHFSLTQKKMIEISSQKITKNGGFAIYTCVSHFSSLLSYLKNKSISFLYSFYVTVTCH